VVATSVLAVGHPVVLYLLLAVAGLACIPLTLLRGRSRRD
jgi:hypothetical protein